MPEVTVRRKLNIVRNSTSKLDAQKTYKSLNELDTRAFKLELSGSIVDEAESNVTLRILTGKKHPKIKLQRLRKIRIWTFGSLLYQINSF